MRKPGPIRGATASAAAFANEAFKSSGERPAMSMTDADLEQGPLSARDLALIEQAFERRRALGRAITLARANGVTLLATGLLCLPFAIFEPWLWLAAFALVASGFCELRGARLFRALDLRAPKWLATNQLVLLGAIALYCGLGIYNGLHTSSPIAELGDEYPDLSSQLKDLAQNLGSGEGALVDHGYRVAVIGFYLAVLAACGLYQGLCAYFYLKRARVLKAHRDLTPAWVLRLEQRLFG
jgi:hypothetical protein